MSKVKIVKRERFVRVVESRMAKLLDAFDSIGKCSNKSNYEYSENDIREIFKEIAKKTREIKMLFDVCSKEKYRFKLKK